MMFPRRLCFWRRRISLTLGLTVQRGCRRKKRRANFDAPKYALSCECFVAKRSPNIFCLRPHAVNDQV